MSTLDPSTISSHMLIGTNGNAFAIIAKVTQIMNECGCPKVHIDEYQQKAFAGDYNHLLTISCNILDNIEDFMEVIQ